MYKYLIAAIIIGAAGVAAQTCNPGQFIINGACVDCPAGSYSTGVNAISCARAQRGHFVPIAGQQNQTPCAKGSFSNVRGSNGCTNCPVGQFSSVEGATGCCRCCAGYFQPNTGAASSECSATIGMYSPATICAQNSRFCPAVFTDRPSAGVRKRQVKRCEKYQMLCPTGVGNSECVDIQSDLWTCGGCLNPGGGLGTKGAGRDCTVIPHVDAVSCFEGKCLIGTCVSGYEKSSDGKTCVRSDDQPQY